MVEEEAIEAPNVETESIDIASLKTWSTIALKKYLIVRNKSTSGTTDELIASSCISTLISAAQQYHIFPAEANLLQLQRQLDVFIQLSSKGVPAKVSDLSQLITVELYSCLLELLDDSSQRPFQHSLAQRSLVVLLNLASDPRVCEALNEKYNLASLLVTYLREHVSSTSDSDAITCVTLLQRVTYGWKLKSSDGAIDDLVDFLVTQILANTSEFSERCCAVLSNICTNNFYVQTRMLHRKDAKHLVKKLITQLNNSGHLVTVHCLSILHSVFAKHGLANMVFSSKNITQTFLLMFNILLNNHDLQVRTAIVDLFVYMMQDTNIQQALSGYVYVDISVEEVLGELLRPSWAHAVQVPLPPPHVTPSAPSTKDENEHWCFTKLETCIGQTVLLVPSTTGSASSADGNSHTAAKSKKQYKQAAKIFELLLSFCRVNRLRCVVCKTLLESPTLKDPVQYKQLLGGSHVTEPFFALVHWATQSVSTHQDAPLLALQFINEIYEEMLTQCGGGGVSMTPRLDLTLPMLTDVLQATLNIEEDLLLGKRCTKQLRALQILNTLCSDSTLRLQAARALDVQTCSRVARWQLKHNTVGVLTRESVDYNPTDWREVGLDVVLKNLQVMNALGDLVSDMPEALNSLLQEQAMMGFFARALHSTSRDRVQTTLLLLKRASALPDFPSILLGDTLVSLNNRHAMAEEMKEINSLPSDSGHGSSRTPLTSRHWHDNKENAHLMGNGFSRRSMSVSSGLPEDLEQSLDMLVEKLQTGLDVKDLKTSEVLSVYQAKLQSLQVKESHVEELLEAKSLALKQADRLIAEYRSKRAKAEAEMNMLRAHLRNSERTCEALQEQVNELMLNKESMTNDVEELVTDNSRLQQAADRCQELQEAYTEQGFRLESAKKSLEALKAEHMAMAEMHDMLKRHNDTLKQQNDVATQQLQESEEERRLLSVQLKDREAKISEYSKAMKRTDERLRKLEADRDELEVAIDGLRSELSNAEDKRKKLSHEVKTLELLVCEHEKNLNEKESQIKKLRSELDKQAELSAIIHKLTGGLPQ